MNRRSFLKRAGLGAAALAMPVATFMREERMVEVSGSIMEWWKSRGFTKDVTFYCYQGDFGLFWTMSESDARLIAKRSGIEVVGFEDYKKTIVFYSESGRVQKEILVSSMAVRDRSCS